MIPQQCYEKIHCSNLDLSSLVLFIGFYYYFNHYPFPLKIVIHVIYM